MFLFLPWRVDVPQDRRPVMNWLILAGIVAVFALQVADVIEYLVQQETAARDTRPGNPGTATPTKPPSAPPTRPPAEPPGITDKLMLRGWSLRGLLGYMWLHAGLLHLLGNLLFLWIFGNAVCAKIGNLRYLGLYVLFGVAAGIAHLLLSPAAVLGASGAINGIVGMYLVLYYQNDITCLFLIWFIVPLYVRTFAVSSLWLILLRLLWDIVGAFGARGSGVAYFAHLGGFGAGFAIALLMCRNGWITMERYERSLLQMWQERRHGRQKDALDTTYTQLGLHRTDEERATPETGGQRTEGRGQRTEDSPATRDPSSVVSPPESPPAPRATPSSAFPEPIPLHPIEPGPAPGTPLSRAASFREPIGRWAVPGSPAFIRTACSCGHAIRVTRQYAGRTVRCPHCRQPVVIPPQTDFFGPAPQPAHGSAILKRAHDDVIRFLCPCGRRIKAPAAYAGRTCRCPQCNTTLRIPQI
ncbi:MAG: rhomboid family intramembrane serine protease [Planctomycetes bacterium]|nr:rhomboid family intramembrane serine protease [Planctomycetota bacterium]